MLGKAMNPHEKFELLVRCIDDFCLGVLSASFAVFLFSPKRLRGVAVTIFQVCVIIVGTAAALTVAASITPGG